MGAGDPNFLSTHAETPDRGKFAPRCSLPLSAVVARAPSVNMVPGADCRPGSGSHWEKEMSMTRNRWFGLLASLVAAMAASAPAAAQQQQQKPNILFIMGDDIGWMQPSIYH